MGKATCKCLNGQKYEIKDDIANCKSGVHSDSQIYSGAGTWSGAEVTCSEVMGDLIAPTPACATCNPNFIMNQSATKCVSDTGSQLNCEKQGGANPKIDGCTKCSSGNYMKNKFSCLAPGDFDASLNEDLTILNYFSIREADYQADQDINASPEGGLKLYMKYRTEETQNLKWTIVGHPVVINELVDGKECLCTLTKVEGDFSPDTPDNWKAGYKSHSCTLLKSCNFLRGNLHFELEKTPPIEPLYSHCKKWESQVNGEKTEQHCKCFPQRSQPNDTHQLDDQKRTTGWITTCSCPSSGKSYPIVTTTESDCKKSCIINGLAIDSTCVENTTITDLESDPVTVSDIMFTRKKMTCGVPNCSTLVTSGNLQNCLVENSGNCLLCKEGYKVDSNACVVDNTNCSAYSGCKFCHTSGCLICDEYYAKNSSDNTCVLQTIVSSNFIDNCKYHYLNNALSGNIDKKCYQCDTNYVSSSNGESCTYPAEGFENQLAKCRIFSDINLNKCEECLPESSAIIGNTGCQIENTFPLNSTSVINFHSSTSDPIFLGVDNAYVQPGDSVHLLASLPSTLPLTKENFSVFFYKQEAPGEPELEVPYLECNGLSDNKVNYDGYHVADGSSFDANNSFFQLKDSGEKWHQELSNPVKAVKCDLTWKSTAVIAEGRFLVKLSHSSYGKMGEFKTPLGRFQTLFKNKDRSAPDKFNQRYHQVILPQISIQQNRFSALGGAIRLKGKNIGELSNNWVDYETSAGKYGLTCQCLNGQSYEVGAITATAGDSVINNFLLFYKN